MKTFNSLPTSYQWNGARYSLTQGFCCETSDSIDCAQVVAQLDLIARDRAALPVIGRLFKWQGGALFLGPLKLIELGTAEIDRTDRPHDHCARLSRRIDGGILAASPGGSRWFRCAFAAGRVTIEAGLDRYLPRLPRFVYLRTQEPFHRLVFERAFGDLQSLLAQWTAPAVAPPRERQLSQTRYQ